MVSEISQRSREIFAARLVVVSVATRIWKETVSAFASMAAASIIDISDPTENLLWELAELERRCDGRFILIGEYSRIAGWADGISADEHPLSARLTELLGDRDDRPQGNAPIRSRPVWDPTRARPKLQGLMPCSAFIEPATSMVERHSS
jgi:hypothetical protein